MTPLIFHLGLPTESMMAHPDAFAIVMHFTHLDGVPRPFKIAFFVIVCVSRAKKGVPRPFDMAFLET